MKTFLRFLRALIGLSPIACLLSPAAAQQPKNVQTSQVAATRGQIIEDLSFGSGRTGSFLTGSTLSIAGALSGTPTGGSFNLSNLTLTLPGGGTITGAGAFLPIGASSHAAFGDGGVFFGSGSGLFFSSTSIYSGGIDVGIERISAGVMGITNGAGGSFPRDLSLRSLTSTGGTITAGAATTSRSSLNIPHGTAPTSPTNGDVWTTTAGMYVRVNGSTVGPLGTSGSATLSDGDYGDVVVSSSGTVISFDTGVVTAAAKTVLDDSTVSAMVDTLGGASATGTGGLVRKSDPVILRPGSAMGALSVDVTKLHNTKTVTAAHALTFSATPPAGTTFGVDLTGDSTARVITLPASCVSAYDGSALASFTMPANGYAEVSFYYTGSAYTVAGYPTSIADLTTGTPVSGSYLPVNVSGVDGKATVANTVLAGMPALTGDVTSSAGAAATTLATVNSNVGTFGSATAVGVVTVNGKGLVTAASNTTVTPAVGNITGLGTGVATALAVNVGSAGAPVVNGGALGTPSSGTLTNATGLPVAGITASTSTALGVGSVELGHASDTSLSRASAGVLAVEGVVVPTISSTNTLSNKRIDARITTIASSATPTINTDNCDAVTITALAAAITSMTTNLSGTPTNFDQLMFRIKDDGTGRAITWGASFAARGATLPTTTTASKVLYVLFIWNSVASTWDCVSTATES